MKYLLVDMQSKPQPRQVAADAKRPDGHKEPVNKQSPKAADAAR